MKKILYFGLCMMASLTAAPVSVTFDGNPITIGNNQTVTFDQNVSNQCQDNTGLVPVTYTRNTNGTVTVTCTSCMNARGQRGSQSVTFTPQKVNQIDYGYASNNVLSLHISYQGN